MADPTAAFKLMPGFDFLQGLVKNAGAAIPSVGQWVAPTLNPEEIEKRIDELRTVQFWLEQNARMLGATIQALEVQRMTLSTLKTMNLSFGDLTESLKIKMPEAPEPAPAPPARATPAAEPPPKPKAAEKTEKAESKAPEVPTGVVDPMQLWGALTKQFTELATNAMKDTANQAAKNIAGAMAKQGFEAAGETLKKAAAMPAAMAKSAASAAQKAASVAQAAAGMSPAPASAPASSKTGAKTSATRKRAPGATGAK